MFEPTMCVHSWLERIRCWIVTDSTVFCCTHCTRLSTDVRALSALLHDPLLWLQEAGPYVTALVERRCCKELAKVVELFRPPTATCIATNFLVFR